jgi:hypothetical protein
MTTKIVAGLIGAAFALGAFSPALANGVAHHDTNLERFAKAQLARKMGGLRDAITPAEPLVLVSAEMVARGPVPLNQLPLDHERAAFAAFGITEETGFNFPGRLIIGGDGEAPRIDGELAVASVEARSTYQGAFVTLGN